jgi:ethanolamine ammonia-lyase large subunit
MASDCATAPVKFVVVLCWYWYEVAGAEGDDVGTGAIRETTVIASPVEVRERVGAPEGAEGLRSKSDNVKDVEPIAASLIDTIVFADPDAVIVLAPLASCVISIVLETSSLFTLLYRKSKVKFPG